MADKAETRWIPAPQWRNENKDRFPIGVHAFYQGIEKGQIPSIKVGRRIFIREDALEIMAAAGIEDE